MMKRHSLFWGAVLLVLFSSCERRLTWQQSLKECSGKTIDLNWNKQIFYNDTTLWDDVIMQVPIKIISYIEDNLCDSCLVNYLTGASIFMKENKTDSVLFFAVVSSRNEVQLNNIIRQIDSKSCVIIKDLDGVFLKKNSLEKYTRSFRVFLLDACNQVILSGDPLLNYKLEQLYISTINNLTDRGGVINGEKTGKVQFVNIRPHIIDLGKIHTNEPVFFSVTLNNMNRRPIRVEVESECECTILDQYTLDIRPRSKTKINGSVVVDKEGHFEKYFFIRMKEKDIFQAVTIKGEAINYK